jgi:hypothetical protein
MLARAGYGTPEQVLNMRADIVVMVLLYESFRGDYERAYFDLNDPAKK